MSNQKRLLLWASAFLGMASSMVWCAAWLRETGAGPGYELAAWIHVGVFGGVAMALAAGAIEAETRP